MFIISCILFYILSIYNIFTFKFSYNYYFIKSPGRTDIIHFKSYRNLIDDYKQYINLYSKSKVNFFQDSNYTFNKYIPILKAHSIYNDDQSIPSLSEVQSTSSPPEVVLPSALHSPWWPSLFTSPFASLRSATGKISSSVISYVKSTRLYGKISEAVIKFRNRILNLTLGEKVLLLITSQFIYSFILPNYHILLPVQLLPFDSGITVDVGFDTLISIAIMSSLINEFYSSTNNFNLLSTNFNVDQNIKNRIPFIIASLLGTYLLSGYFSLLVDNLLLMASAIDIPISISLYQSLKLLTGHLFWVITGSLILNFTTSIFNNNEWYILNTHDNWIYHTISGYLISCTLYNLTDFIQQFILKIINHTQLDLNDNVVHQLTNNNNLIATIIGAIGPCITAPWWEEILYRIFINKSLSIYLPKIYSIIISSLLFALHHLNPYNTLQLFTLGLTWAVFQEKYNNLFIPILIHALWNTRIFITNIAGR